VGCVILKHFSFLQKHGFEIVVSGDGLVRFESGRVFLSVAHDERRKAVKLTFGRLLGSRCVVDLFDDEDLAELADPPGNLKWRFVRAREPRQLDAVLAGYAEFLKTRARAVLRGKTSVFERLSMARRVRTEAAARRTSRRLARSSSLAAEVVRRRPAQAEPAPGPATADRERERRLEEARLAAREMLRLPLECESRQDWTVCMLGLEPHPMDYDRVFAPGVALRAVEVYRTLWREECPVIEPDPGATTVQVAAFYSDWLRGDDERARRYPSSYRRIAGMLQPDVIWLAWRYPTPGDHRGRTYDGLVWLEDAFAWFPRPGDLLAPLN
jgi:hypothetical protein